MAFKAGSIYGEAVLDTKKWTGPAKGLSTSVKVGLAAAGAAVVAFATKAIKAGDEFQRAMSNVATVIDTTQVSTQQLAMQLFQLDPALGSTTELTNALYQSFSAGAQTAEEAMQTTVDAARFARAGLTDTATAVDVLTTAVNAYGSETVSTTQASDIFFKTIELGKTTGAELASTIGSSIPLFASSGIALEELSAGIATMTKQGNNAAEATTQLNAIVSAFLSPSAALEEQLQSVGAASGSAFLEAEGLTGALSLLEDATGGNAGKMAELLPNIRALRGAMALTGQGGDILTETLAEMENAAGATEVAFNKQEKTFDTLRNQMEKVMVITGNIGKHFADQIAVGATQSTSALINFIVSADAMNIVAEVVGVLAGAFTVVKTVLTELWDVVRPAITEIWGMLTEKLASNVDKSEALAGASKILSVALNLVTSAVTVAIKIIKTQIELYADWIIAIKETAGVAGEFFKFLSGRAQWEDVRAQARSAGDAFVGLGQNFKDNIGDIFQTVRDEVRTFGQETEDINAKLSADVETAYVNASEGVRNNWGELITGQEDFADAMLTQQLKLQNDLAETNDGLVQDTEETVEELSATWDDYWGALETGTNQIFGSMQSIRSQAFENEKARLDNRIAEEQAQLERRREMGIITEEQYEEQKQQLDERAQAQQNELAKRQFQSQKNFQMTQLFIDTAAAIVGWWRTASRIGFPFGPIFGATMTAATLALSNKQAKLIEEQQFVPARQFGGMARGLTRINEAGGEIVSLPDGSQVVPNDISRQIAERADNRTEINVSFAGAQINDNMDLERVTDAVVRKLGRRMRVAS